MSSPIIRGNGGVAARNTNAPTNESLTILGAKRVDSPSLDFNSFDGAQTALTTDQYGALRVTLDSAGAQPNGPQVLDSSGWAGAGGADLLLIGGTVNDSTVTPLITGTSATVRISSNRGLLTENVPYTIAIDWVGGPTPQYIGYTLQGNAKSAAAWQIRKLTFDGINNPTDVQFANGSPAFNAIWDNRASLSYS